MDWKLSKHSIYLARGARMCIFACQLINLGCLICSTAQCSICYQTHLYPCQMQDDHL